MSEALPELPELPECDDAAEMPQPETETPRLSIMHLMVWTAITAVYFSCLRMLMNAASESPQAAAFGGQGVPWMIMGVGNATALAGLVLLVARRFRGMPFLTHPGEKLWALLGFSGISFLAQYALVLQVIKSADSSSMIAVSAMSAVSGLVTFVLHIWAAMKSTGLWRLYFVAAVLFPFVFGCFGTPLLMQLGRPAMVLLVAVVSRGVIGLILLMAVVGDHRRKIRYPWTHWVGVGLGLWNAGVIGMFNIVAMFMIR